MLRAQFRDSKLHYHLRSRKNRRGIQSFGERLLCQLLNHILTRSADPSCQAGRLTPLRPMMTAASKYKAIRVAQCRSEHLVHRARAQNCQLSVRSEATTTRRIRSSCRAQMQRLKGSCPRHPRKVSTCLQTRRLPCLIERIVYEQAQSVGTDLASLTTTTQREKATLSTRAP